MPLGFCGGPAGIRRAGEVLRGLGDFLKLPETFLSPPRLLAGLPFMDLLPKSSENPRNPLRISGPPPNLLIFIDFLDFPWIRTGRLAEARI